MMQWLCLMKLRIALQGMRGYVWEQNEYRNEPSTPQTDARAEGFHRSLAYVMKRCGRPTPNQQSGGNQLKNSSMRQPQASNKQHCGNELTKICD